MAPQPSSTTNNKTPADLFAYGIKRDPTAYPSLHKESQYDNWFREFHAVGSSHGLDNLFDDTYVPVGHEATELFKLQQKFLYSVLCTKLLTSNGKDST